jgi:hypothetical protein
MPALDLELEPYESRVIVFNRIPREKVSEATRNISPIPPSRTGPQPLDLSAGWNVTVGKTAPSQWQQLHSWADDASTRYYSGVVTYEKEIDVPANFRGEKIKALLDFGKGTPITPVATRNGMQTWLDGPIRDAAVVYINDKRAGSVWCPPYALDVSSFLQTGRNKIRIEVANTAMNYMAGHSLPDYKLLNLRFGERFQPQDMDKIQPLPSGLLGPIKLVATN